MAPNLRSAFITTLLLFSWLASHSHNLKGFITGKDGTPIPYATVFIKEISLGTTTNDDGKFELDLEVSVIYLKFKLLLLIIR
jgi:hypothetical protein